MESPENFSDSDFALFRKAAIESSSDGSFDNINFEKFDKILKENYKANFGYPKTFIGWYDGQLPEGQRKFMSEVFNKMYNPKKIDLNNLQEKDYAFLKDLANKYKNEFGNIDIEGFTNSLRSDYGVDLREWYKTDEDKKAKIVDKIFGHNPYTKAISEVTNIENSSIIDQIPKVDYVNYDQVTSEILKDPASLRPEIHYASNIVPSVETENISLDENLRIDRSLHKDTSLEDSVTAAVGKTSSSNDILSAKLSAIGKIIGNGVDAINANSNQNTNVIASVVRGSNKGNSFSTTPNMLGKQEDIGINLNRV